MFGGELVAAIDELTASLKESLKHPRHQIWLQPAKLQAESILRRFFDRQRSLTLQKLRPTLKRLAIKEVDADDKARADAVLPAGFVLPIALNKGIALDYGEVLTGVLAAGYENLAKDLGRSTYHPAEDFTHQYLEQHSLAKLTGDFSETSVQRLRDAIAGAYASGGQYDQLVSAVQDTFGQFSSVRAGMIAQTEMNNAYNAGRVQIGKDLGFNEKSWNPDGIACPLCMGNVMQGWIPMEEYFLSGDYAPVAHPNCDCSLDVRFNAEAV